MPHPWHSCATAGGARLPDGAPRRPHLCQRHADRRRRRRGKAHRGERAAAAARHAGAVRDRSAAAAAAAGEAELRSDVAQRRRARRATVRFTMFCARAVRPVWPADHASAALAVPAQAHRRRSCRRRLASRHGTGVLSQAPRCGPVASLRRRLASAAAGCNATVSECIMPRAQGSWPRPFRAGPGPCPARSSSRGRRRPPRPSRRPPPARCSDASGCLAEGTHRLRRLNDDLTIRSAHVIFVLKPLLIPSTPASPHTTGSAPKTMGERAIINKLPGARLRLPR